MYCNSMIVTALNSDRTNQQAIQVVVIQEQKLHQLALENNPHSRLNQRYIVFVYVHYISSLKTLSHNILLFLPHRNLDVYQGTNQTKT